ncbi:hypothetical protein [Marinicella meishanensis]|uniref:hypothetical protein n=1 Tax=Marinicella meishanensis TaxID=2873263 RepID=UPI001CBD20C2|nr:hypothetical protein [Marinicella sp. NBU2979]
MNDLSATEMMHFHSFVEQFAPSKHLRDRWRYFAGKNQANYWGAVEPMKYWEVSCNHFNTVDLSTVAFHEWQKCPPIAQLDAINDSVVLVACGHADPDVSSMGLSEFFQFDSLDLPIEFVASLKPGKVVLVANHNGESLLLQR